MSVMAPWKKRVVIHAQQTAVAYLFTGLHLGASRRRSPEGHPVSPESMATPKVRGEVCRRESATLVGGGHGGSHRGAGSCDLHFGQDMFTEEGRKELDRLMADEALYCEHWAPECHLFSRARGRPIQLADGRTVQDPQPVRDQKHLMAFLGFLLRQRLGSGAPTTWCSRPSEGENSFARPLAPATGQWNTPTAPACGSSLW